MNISFFKDCKAVLPLQKSKDIDECLQRIREGKSRTLVKEIRSEIDKGKKDLLKLKLPAVTFGGVFKKRNKESLIKASGFIVLDFDNINNKDVLKLDPLIYACWISPSGCGVKAIVKIPIIENDKEFKQIFKQLRDIYPSVDKSGSDITRLCFESYDPDLHINENAEVFLPNFDYLEPSNDFIFAKSNIPIQDSEKIAERLLKWFKDKYDSKARNNSLFKLASAFNDFGVDKLTADIYISQFEQKDFNKNEITAILNSAYKKTENFNSKQFEDTATKNKIKNLVLRGTPEKNILEQFAGFDGLENELNILKNNINFEQFWELDNKGKLEILPYRFKLFLEKLNYRKYYPSKKNQTFILIKKEGNFVDITSEFLIKDEVLNHLINNGDIDAFNVCADKLPIFTQKYLSMIDTAEIEINKDCKDFAMIYYKNLSIKVYSDRIEKIDYSELDKYVWKTQIIDREYKDVDHHDSQFRSFVWFACGQDVNKYNTMKSVIGYLLHGHKTSANNKAIVFNDETISESPNGRSGKGIIINAISQMKKTSVIDGKNFDFAKSFAFQTVNTDTQVLAFDDVKKNFDFEKLFSVITEGITIEYKGKDAIKIPVNDSPKIIISTNYTIKADGDSFEGRMFEIEMSNFFNAKNTPYDYFGNLLYEDWDLLEWQRFDKFMINCLQYYLENGIIKSKTNNLKLRKFINDTSQDFYEYSIKEKQVPLNIRLIKNDYLTKYIEEFPDSRKYVSVKTVVKWLKKYADYSGLKTMEGVSNGKRWIEVIDTNCKEAFNETEIPF